MTNDELKQITDLAKRQVDLQIKIEKAEEFTAKLRDDLKKVQEDLLPEAMLEAGVSEFSLTDGTGIKIEKDFSVQISKDKAPTCYAWLEKRGVGAIIKHTLLVRWDKQLEKKAEKAQAQLIKLGLAPEVGQSVHPQTLKATLRELMESGVDVPEKTFNLFRYSKAKIKLPS